MKIRVGSRESELAKIQAKILIDSINEYDKSIEVELVTMRTKGDIFLNSTLEKIGGKGLFTKELENALLNHEIDLCVHSFKDMPMDMDENLPIIALSKRENPLDVLILPEGKSEIDFSKPIGTSSMRRSLQFKKLYSEAITSPIRGNILTRLKKLDSGEFSGIIVAYAGIKRLGLTHRIHRVFNGEEILPAASQGILAVQGRSGESYDFLNKFNSEESFIVSVGERAFIKALGGNCFTPTACYGVIKEEKLELKGMYFNEETGEMKTGSVIVDCDYAQYGGIGLANKLKNGISGKVTLVGAGPYDKGLITVKGLNAIKSADCILYDRLANPELLLEAPINCEKIDVSKESSNHKVSQENINKTLLQRSLVGKNVVRLKGGDPYVFGRGGEELALIKEHNIPFEVIPGITSPIAALTYAGIPVTHRDLNSSLHIITGHRREGKELNIDFESLVKVQGTLIFLMSVTNLDYICRGLINGGMEPTFPGAIVENGTTSRQRVFSGTVSNLTQIASENNIVSPSIIVFGEVVNLRNELNFLKYKPLSRTKIVIASHLGSIEKLENMLYEKGCDVISYPSASVEPLFIKELDFNLYNYILFTSKQGVHYFLQGLFNLKLDIRILANKKIACVGSETEKELNKYGIFCDFIPLKYNGKTLSKGLIDKISPNDSVLFPGALEPSEDLINIFSEHGMKLTHIPVYKTVLIKNPKINLSDVDYVMFTSKSTVRGFVNSIGEENVKNIRAICIGEQTESAAKSFGMKTFVSSESTFKSMVKLVEELSCK